MLLFKRFFSRRRSGLSTVAFIFAIFACLSSLLTTIATPMAWQRAQAAKRLPRPVAGELETLPPGSRALFSGHLSKEAAGQNAPHGLALYKVEIATPSTTDDDTTTPAPSSWTLETPPQERVDFLLEENLSVTLQLPQDVALANAHVFEEEQDGVRRRYVGYLPGQALTVEGVWEGHNLITAHTLYAGSPDAYIEYLQHQPGQTAVGGMICGSTGLVLLLAAAILRLLGH
ncbi:MAG: hypothetical protein WHX52_12625 [Anaerolineae bacterium]